jgi:hypothetical protein
MTTIAYRAGTIAADTGQTNGSSRSGYSSKIARNAQGDLCAAAGFATYAWAFKQWFLKGELADRPKASDSDRGLIIRRDGTIIIFEDTGYFDMRAEYYAIGSGRPEALGAMFMGATARQAVEAAMRHDANTFGEIEELSFDAP